PPRAPPPPPLPGGAGQLLVEAVVLALELADPALGVTTARLQFLAPGPPGPGGPQRQEQKYRGQETQGREQNQQLSLGELAERSVEQGGGTRGGVLEAGRGDHDSDQEGEQQEEYGHLGASSGLPVQQCKSCLLAPPQPGLPNGASSHPWVAAAVRDLLCEGRSAAG